MYTTIINRAGWLWLVAGILALFVVAAMTGVVSGGPLDPPGAPAPTQKTLDQIAPVWSQVLAANDGPDSCHSSRFLCVLGDAAVLYRETGLVWERAPSLLPRSSWFAAREECRTLSLDGRKGWRVPSEEELQSLLGGAAPGNPFTLAISTAYWTATTLPDDPAYARVVSQVASGNTIKTDAARLRWCVRGGAAADGL
jgi:hypothetical protein